MQNATAEACNLTYPLNRFYETAGRALPVLSEINGVSMPEPYQKLLVHEGDMTPTLEAFHGEKLALQVCRSWRENDSFFREVVLRTKSGKAVEYGAIRIELPFFDAQSQQEILDCKRPLGSILNGNHIPHQSRPAGFFSVNADSHIGDALQLNGRRALYGRRNRLLTEKGEILAEIVEILPP